VVSRVYPAYQQQLLASNAVDFDDLLLHIAILLKENPELRAALDSRYRYILVDEYQDTNLAQYAIVRAMSIDAPNLSVTGDPDQSIYGWRGANLGNILEFEKDYPNVLVVRLEQNYRSTQSILRVADHLISYNTRRKEKKLYTENAEGRPVQLVYYPTQRAEAETIAARIAHQVASSQRRPRDFAVLYRINALSRALEFAMRDLGVPYQMVNGLEFYQRMEIKDVLAYLHLINNPRDDVALLRVINRPPRRIGKTTITRLMDHAGRYGLTLLEAARESGLIESLNKRAAVAVAKFVAMFDQLTEKATAPVKELVDHVLDKSDYRKHLADSDDETDQERLANIEELLTAAMQFDEQNPGIGHLEDFLEQASLVADTDAWENDTDKVTLMTMHAAKGLEFPVVFIIAMEEGLLPHERSRNDPEQLEEERRLLFVGITRAEEELELSLAVQRDFRGERRMTVPSMFLLEMPRDEMEQVRPGLVYDQQWDQTAQYEFEDEEYEDTESTPGFDVPAAIITTAADMLVDAESVSERVSPDVFRQDMVVIHPDYGPGKIVALSGTGERRTATVNFAAGDGQKSFVLSMCPLRPAN
jgi:DNA helicase-2/ATP-dependent DNA helicase PcrA